jgi:hypothetical protein
MKKHFLKQIVVISVILIGFSLLWGCKTDKTTAEAAEEPGFQAVSELGVTFQWKIEDGMLEGILTGNTEGWIAVGFNPTDMMEGANLVIGYVEDEEVYIRDDYGSWLTSHVSDESVGGSDDINIISGEEKNGTTSLRFSIPIDSGDEYDGTLNLGGKNTILLSYGGNDSFTSMHRGKTKLEVDF